MQEPEFVEFSLQDFPFQELERRVSCSKRKAAVIGIRDDGFYTFELYEWDTTDWEYLGHGYWSCCGSGGIFESLECARAEAYVTI